MIKHGQCALTPILSKLFNACLITGHYPTSWAGGAIRVIHKAGSYSDPNNYRGITITSAIGKLFNIVLNERLDKFLVKNNIILHDCQIGFTKKARTSDHMFILKSILETYCNDRNGRVYACFIDFRKAFDTVIHTGIKIKLLQIGVGSKFYNIVKSMYGTSTSCIRLKNGVTDSFPVHVGVKQGDNLSPNLFKIFINDLPSYVQNTQDPIKLNDKDIHCLMFADDIVLFSKSKVGLQEKLNKLQDYCKDWCLSVNTSKTKIMVFNKAGKLITHQFMYDGKPLECVKSYKYLGIHFSVSGSFALAQSELYNKALKALYKLKRNFLCLNPGVRSSLNVFDHTIKPILMYCSEIWGPINQLSSRFLRKPSITVDEIFSKLLCNNLHIKFCKSILGVHRKSSNFAVLSELGRHPLHYDILKQSFVYFQRLNTLGNSFPLLKAAFNCSYSNYLANKPSWYGSVTFLKNKVGEIDKIKSQSLNSFAQSCKKILKEHFLNSWAINKFANQDRKLCTYVTFKTNIGLEKYLQILPHFEDRRRITKFRISAHKLLIETGRYKGIPRTNRICDKCILGEVEDECHFFFKCQKFNCQRNQLMNVICKSCPNFTTLKITDQLIWALSCESVDVLLAISEFIKLCE